MSTETMPEEFDFPLTKGIKYATKEGVESDGVFIKLTPPSIKQLTHCTILKQSFFRAISAFEDKVSSKETKEQDKDEKAPLDGKAIISAMYMSDVDMVKVLLEAKQLFKTGVANMDGEIKMTSPMLDDMGQDDLENMIGEYMANFILFSVLKEMR